MVYFLIVYYCIIATYNPEVLGVNFSSVFLGGFLLISGLVILTKKVIIIDCPKAYIMYIVVSFAYIIPSESMADGVSAWLKMCMPFIVLVAVENVFQHRANEFLNKLAIGIGISNWFACLIGFASYFRDDPRSYTAMIGGVRVLRMTGAFLQANVFASYILISMAFGIYAACKIGYGQRSLVFITIAMNSVCLIMSFSRWAIISTCVALVAYYLCVYGFQIIRIKKATALLILCATICGIFVCLSRIDYIWTQIQNFFIHEESTNIRSYSMIAALKAVADNLFLGIGMGNLPKTITILDSSILNIFVRTGILGFVSFVAFCIYVGKNLLKAIDRTHIAFSLPSVLFYSYLVFMVNSIAESIVFNALINTMLAIYVFASTVFETDKRKAMQPY